MIVYLDFDGVILDTVSIILKEIDKHNINLKKDSKSFFENLDWNYILNNAKEISDSISTINNLKGKYNIKILTHISSKNEQNEKLKFINDKFNDIDVIFVPKKCAKSSYVSALGNVLIDDSKKNVNDWINNGGKAYLFNGKNIKDIIEGGLLI